MITLKLHPSNPSSRDVWRDVDERFQELGITSYSETYKSNKPDRGIETDDDIDSKMRMAEDGYGDVSATGVTEEGTLKTIRMRGRSQISLRAPSGLVSSRDILRNIWRKFQEMFGRFEN